MANSYKAIKPAHMEGEEIFGELATGR